MGLHSSHSNAGEVREGQGLSGRERKNLIFGGEISKFVSGFCRLVSLNCWIFFFGSIRLVRGNKTKNVFEKQGRNRVSF